MPKRTLLFLFAGGLLACGLPMTQAPNIQGLNPLSEQTRSNLNAIRNRFGLEVTRLNYNDARLPWQMLSLLSYKPYLPVSEQGQPANQIPTDAFDKLLGHPAFVEEINKYPSGFFQTQGIDALYFARELTFGVGPLNMGLTGIGLQLEGKKYPLISFEARNLSNYTSDSPSIINYLSEIAIERLMPTIHHELFHVIDEALILGEPSWNRCQPTADEQRRFHQPQKTVYHPAAGFVTPYAQSIFREDKAEVYRMMMSGATAQYLDAWIAAGDQVLKCKRDWIQNYLESRVPAMNADYFEAVKLGLGGEVLNTALKQPESLTRIHLKGPDPNLAYWSREEIPAELPLPSAISRYGNLTEILAEHNQWTQVETLVHLPKLKKLWLSAQRLSSFPEVIAALPALESLVFYASLSEIPTGLARMKELKALSLKLKNLKGFEELQALQLEEIELLVETLSDLHALFLPQQTQSINLVAPLSNQPFNLHPSFKQLRRLAITNLSVDGYQNNLDQFKTHIVNLGQLNELTHLRLRGILLPELETTLAPLQKLEVLSLALPAPQDFNPSLLNLPKLKTLVLEPLFFVNQWGEPAAQTELQRIQTSCHEHGLTCHFDLHPGLTDRLFGNYPWPFSAFLESKP
ncbi:MAG: putative zinc-binding metallopeptidase [Candidatus Sericytochromatia bacterium]